MTDDARKATIAALRAGLSFADAAVAAGVTHRTLCNWFARGRRERRGRFFQFFRDCQMAALARKVACRKVVNRAVEDGDVKAAMWELERGWPDEYGPDRIKVAELDRENRRLADLVRRLEAGGAIAVRPDGPAGGDDGPTEPPTPGRRKRAAAEPAPPAAASE